MQIPLQITMHEVPSSPELEAQIREKAGRLEEFHPRIMSCRVTVEKLDRHSHQGGQFRVRIDVRVPGKEIVANRDHHEDVFVALRDAFDSAKRQLEEQVREARGDVKLHEPAQHGKVARLVRDEGYGFIETADGRELYFGRDNVVHPRFDQIEVGAQVQFIEEAAAAGAQAQAKRVSVGKHHFE